MNCKKLTLTAIAAIAALLLFPSLVNNHRQPEPVRELRSPPDLSCPNNKCG